VPVLDLLPHFDFGFHFAFPEIFGFDLKDLLPEVDAAELGMYGFHAETNPLGPAIDLVWELPDPTAAPDDYSLFVLRRERRFPGRGRRGVVPVAASGADLADGLVVYDPATFEFDLEEKREELLDGRRIETVRQYLFRGLPRDRLLVRRIRRELDPSGATALRTEVRVVDHRALEAGTIYYYTAFVGPGRFFNRSTQDSALATGRVGPALFPLVPSIDQKRDTLVPPPFTVALEDEGRGQLERFVRTAEAHADMVLGFVDGLRDVHNPLRADARLLPTLAHMIGWDLKDYLDEDGQRNEIVFAPEVYRSIGTFRNLAAMINRLTGWDAEVHEFARNIVVSFDGDRLERLETTTAYLDSRAVVGPGSTISTRFPPVGSIDTSDPGALFRLHNRTPDDTNSYVYDCGRPNSIGGYDRDDDVVYNRETIGVYVIPDVPTESFQLQEEWKRVSAILSAFLPIQVRVLFILLPGVVVEEPYDATQLVTEWAQDSVALLQDELYGEGADEVLDVIPEWHWVVSNDLVSHSVDTLALPVDLGFRVRHIAVEAGS
jgi:phage tail-like protein